jgi:hypothetical protein
LQTVTDSRLAPLPPVLRRGLAAALFAALALFAVANAPAASAAGAHPRIFLDGGTLGQLRARAAASDSDWTALRARCDRYRANAVEFPDGAEYPSGGGIGEGYQGEGYFGALLDVGLCYQVALGIDPAAAERYGAVGAAVLEHMSAPKGDPHFQDPGRDSGYGVRFYGAGMAIGYDWLFPALTPALRSRVTASIQTWLTSFESKGFEHDFPQGNYFAGYYAAKAYAGMALSGDSAIGDQILADWQGRVQGGMVQPYSAQNLSGGGWPEGWNYGPLGATNMSLPALAAKTALGADLVHDKSHPFTYPINNPRYLMYFTWPSMRTLDDADKTYDGANPTEAPESLFATETGLLRAFGDPFAPYFASFADQVRKLNPSSAEGDLWDNFLFWDPKAAQRPYSKLPRSYLAKGMEAAAVRSDWSPKAVWGTFKSGPYTNSPEAGWQYFDEGSVAIVNGDKPFLVNAPGALLRDTPGTPAGREFESKISDDLFFGDPANKDLFNVFYVDKPSPWGQTTRLRSEGARTQMSSFHDGGSYVAMTGSQLEDMYQGTVKGWTRQVVYVRPGLFVVYDRTKVADPAIDQWMAFHFSGEPKAVKGGRGGAKRYDVKGPAGYLGSVDTVLPRRHRDSAVPVLGARKVVRLEIRPGRPGTDQQWLTVFDAARSPGKAAAPSPLKAKGEKAGVLLHRRHGGNQALLFGGHNAAHVHYRLPKGRTLNVVTGLKPGAHYAVSSDHGQVDVRRGKGRAADSTGTLAFTTK